MPSVGVADLWDSGKVNSSETVSVAYGGTPLRAMQPVYWRVKTWDENGNECAWSEVGSWETGLPSEGDWQPSEWITQSNTLPDDCGLYDDHPAPLFRTTFVVPDGPLTRARLYIAGLHYYEAEIDGARVGDSYLDPGWTAFDKRVLYSTYDVTAVCTAGEHAFGVTVGNGFVNPLPMRFWGTLNIRDALYTAPPMIRALLVLTFGNQTVVASATGTAAWRVGASEVLRNNVYLGEKHDARLAQPGWSTLAFNASSWGSAVLANTPVGPLQAQLQPPIRRKRTLTPVAITTLPGGSVVVDMGLNHAGVCTFNFSGTGQAGRAVSILYGEILFPNGTVDGMTSVAGQIKACGVGGPCAPCIAYQQDEYILAGKSSEVFTNRFSWHGFRFLEIFNYSGTVTPETVQCHVMYSDVRRVGSVETSSALLNDIYTLAVHGFESNFYSIQMDQPHQERFGYGGDCYASGEAACNMFDMATFYEKRVVDYNDAQGPDGGYPDNAPYVGGHAHGVTPGKGPIGWQVLPTVAQLWAYKYYGNVQLLAASYNATMAFVEYLGRAQSRRIDYGWGDGGALEPAALDLTGRVFQMVAYAAFANFSAVLGELEMASKYSALADAMAEKITTDRLNLTTGVYSGKGWNKTQCGQAAPLFMRIVPPEALPNVLAVMLDTVDASSGHFLVGDWGVHWLLMALSDNGFNEDAYRLMNQTTYPSFGYMLSRNATTLWEDWAYSETQLGHNHAYFGSNAVWHMQSLGGIQPHPAARGMDRLLIKPKPVVELTWVNASLSTVRGVVAVNWTLGAPSACGQRTLEINVVVPPNVQADVWIPSCDGLVYEPFLGDIISVSRGGPSSDVFTTVGSGSYHFASSFTCCG